MFSLPLVIRNKKIERAKLDLGASINVMSYSVYQDLKLNDHEIGVVIQLADRSFIHSFGVVDDVLVQVNELIFPIDFYILKIGNSNSISPTSILLGRPFMKTTKTKIDMDEGTLSIAFDGEIVKFNIFYAMRTPNHHTRFVSIDVINSLEHE